MNNLEIRLNEGTAQTISSREVAKMMEVRHDNLMNKIEKHTAILQKVNDLKIKVVDLWQLSSYKDTKGETRKEYQVTKKGCEFLAHKTTGEKGDIFTIRYMDRFEEMEKIINSNEQLKSQLLLSIYNGGQDGILAAKQLTDLEVQEATKPLYREINHKEDVIVGLVEDIDKILCMTPQLYEIACKVFENDVEELMKEWKNII